MMEEFKQFAKIPRLTRDVFITEKIDGTNACICITDDGEFLTGSRTRWITPDDDNHGFSAWAHEHKGELMALGPGRHFGEWWGKGIQRNYAQTQKRFSLFNVSRWDDSVGGMAQQRPACCGVVPVLYVGILDEFGVMRGVKEALKDLRDNGSRAAPGFMNPEGIVIYHVAANMYFKKTLVKDDEWKGKQKAA